MSCTYKSFIYLHHFIYLLCKNLSKGQITCNDFQNYMNSSKILRFQTVPYSKFLQMCFSRKNIYDIRFKILHVDKEFKTANGCPSLLNQKKQSLSIIPIKVNERYYKKPEDVSLQESKEHKEANQEK